MSRLLHIDSSARRRSFSREVGRRFADVWRDGDPDGTYTYRDLAAHPVPQIGEAWTEICDHALEHGITEIDRYREGVRTAPHRAAWAVVEPLLAELAAADVVLIGAPMYNFSVSAALKAWLDQVTFPRMSLAGRTFVIASARGGSYLPGTPRAPFDHQERYLRDFVKGHFAVDDVHVLNAELTNTRVDPALAHLRGAHEESYAAAIDAAGDLARTIGAERHAAAAS